VWELTEEQKMMLEMSGRKILKTGKLILKKQWTKEIWIGLNAIIIWTKNSRFFNLSAF